MSKIEAGESFNVRLRFVDTQEYLYPADRDFTEDTRRRRVLTFPIDVELENSNTVDWLLEPYSQKGPNEDTVIRLSSIKYPGEYLLAGTDDLALDSKRRKVYTWKETGTDFDQWGGPDQWILVEKPSPDDDRAAFNHFKLRNQKFDEDLQAGGDRFELDKKFGAVYTWRQESEGSSRSVLEIIIRPQQ